MSERRLNLMDIREMIRHIREERSDRQVGKDVGVDRRTVKRYREWAQEQGLLEVCRMGAAQRNTSSLLRESPRPSSRRAVARFTFLPVCAAWGFLNWWVAGRQRTSLIPWFLPPRNPPYPTT